MSTAYVEGWHAQAACAGSDLRLFHRANTAAAQAICSGCPVRAECLYDALRLDAPTGVWGGLTRKERLALPLLPPGKAEAIAALRELLDNTGSGEDTPSEPSPPAEDKQRMRPKAVRPTPRPKASVRQADAAAVTPREDVAALLRKGVTQREIMKQLRVAARVVSATRQAYGIPYSKGPGFRFSPEQRAENERRAVELLRAGATYDEVAKQVGISAPTISAIRKKAGLPKPVRTGGHPRTKAEGLAAYVEPYGDGHARWTGPMAGRMPQLWADGTRFNARRVVFEQHHGRLPTGQVRSTCSEPACIASAHLADHLLRQARPEAGPVTVQALKDLLTEIDHQGGPQAARDNRLHLTAPTDLEPDTMTTTAEPAAPAPAAKSTSSIAQATAEITAEALTLDSLLQWGDEHPDPDIQDQAARARAAVAGLRQRHAADQELTAIRAKAEQLKQRLAKLQAREAELAPAKAKKKRGGSYVRDYDTREVRAWADANGVACPRVGQIPKRVLDAWRAATRGAAS
ncbi:WhiB family transcriptional regulator [Streptomyces sp. NBC_00444]|uniref:WhiB family transcriptional regulator n=1 Tax=Streptomyces sp. NBC_00444 TaxID=2975744 RepID=UPI002E1D9808